MVDETALTFVFSFAPDADPTPSLERRSRLGQQISHTDEGAEFPARKKNEKANDSVFQQIGGRRIKTVKIIMNYFYTENHNKHKKTEYIH